MEFPRKINFIIKLINTKELGSLLIGTRRHGQVPATNNERRREHRPGRNDQVTATRNERRRGLRLWHHDQVPALSADYSLGATAR
jgi:hypothetical protein